MRTFAEYLNNKGKIVEKPSEEAEIGEIPTTPPEPDRPKQHDPANKLPKALGKPAPYGNKSDAKAMPKPEKGLGDEIPAKDTAKAIPPAKAEKGLGDETVKEPSTIKPTKAEKGLGDEGNPKLTAQSWKELKEQFLTFKGGGLAKNIDIKKLSKSCVDAQKKEVEARKAAQEKAKEPKNETTQKPSKTEVFLEQTKDMTVQELANFMLQRRQVDDDNLPTVTAYVPGKFHPHPPEAIKYVVVLADKNEQIMNDLIYALKDQGCLKKLINLLIDEHPETYDTLTDLLGDAEVGPERASNIVRSMDDCYSKFMTDQEDLYETVAPPFGIKQDDKEEFAGQDDTIPTPSEEMPTDEQPEETPESPDEEVPTDEQPPKENGEEENQPTDDNVEMPIKKKLKKKFAHDHLIDAMSQKEYMKARMTI